MTDQTNTENKTMSATKFIATMGVAGLAIAALAIPIGISTIPFAISSWIDAQHETVLPRSVSLKGDCSPPRPEDAKNGYPLPKGCTVTIGD